MPPDTLAELTRYTKLFWLNTGPYNNLTARKFQLDLDRARVTEAMTIAAGNGADFKLAEGETIADRVERFARVLFDPDFEPLVTNKTPGDGQDILASSANNLYDGVTMADLDGFSEQHQLNSRLAMRDGRLVEEVYKVGGLYDTRDPPHCRAPAERDSVCAAGPGQGARPRS